MSAHVSTWARARGCEGVSPLQLSTKQPVPLHPPTLQMDFHSPTLSQPLPQPLGSPKVEESPEKTIPQDSLLIPNDNENDLLDLGISGLPPGLPPRRTSGPHTMSPSAPASAVPASLQGLTLGPIGITSTPTTPHLSQLTNPTSAAPMSTSTVGTINSIASLATINGLEKKKKTDDNDGFRWNYDLKIEYAKIYAKHWMKDELTKTELYTLMSTRLREIDERVTVTRCKYLDGDLKKLWRELKYLESLPDYSINDGMISLPSEIWKLFSSATSRSTRTLAGWRTRKVETDLYALLDCVYVDQTTPLVPEFKLMSDGSKKLILPNGNSGSGPGPGPSPRPSPQYRNTSFTTINGNSTNTNNNSNSNLNPNSNSNNSNTISVNGINFNSSDFEEQYQRVQEILRKRRESPTSNSNSNSNSQTNKTNGSTNENPFPAGLSLNGVSIPSHSQSQALTTTQQTNGNGINSSPQTSSQTTTSTASLIHTQPSLPLPPSKKTRYENVPSTPITTTNQTSSTPLTTQLIKQSSLPSSLSPQPQFSTQLRINQTLHTLLSPLRGSFLIPSLHYHELFVMEHQQKENLLASLLVFEDNLEERAKVYNAWLGSGGSPFGKN